MSLPIIVSNPPPPGEYTVITRKFFNDLRVEMVANPDLFERLGGELRWWHFDVGEQGDGR